MIVDAHHHLWRADRGDYHWMSPSVPLLDRDYLSGDLAPVLRRAGVGKTVLVQAAQTEAETDFLLDLASETDFVAGVVGWLDFDDRDLPRKLDKLTLRPKFAGLRPMLQDLEDDDYILRPQVLDNLRHVASLDLPFDFLIFPRHLRHVVEALDRTPELRAVIDHASKPPIADGGMAGWAEGLAELAGRQKVWCKLSGMVTEANPDTWSPADLQPYVQHVLDTFGEDRIMFGSDWPVCLRAASYAEVLNALRTVLDPQMDASAMAKVFGGNAVEFYKLTV